MTLVIRAKKKIDFHLSGCLPFTVSFSNFKRVYDLGNTLDSMIIKP